jgi:hypothetical protein
LLRFVSYLNALSRDERKVITCQVKIACAEGSIYHLLRMRRKLSVFSSVHERLMSHLATTFCTTGDAKPGRDRAWERFKLQILAIY